MEHKDWNLLEQCAEQKQCKGSKWPDPQHLLNQNLWMIGEWFGLVVSVGGFCRQRHRQSPAWWGDARQTGKHIQLVWDNVVTPPPKKKGHNLYLSYLLLGIYPYLGWCEIMFYGPFYGWLIGWFILGLPWVYHFKFFRAQSNATSYCSFRIPYHKPPRGWQHNCWM